MFRDSMVRTRSLCTCRRCAKSVAGPQACSRCRTEGHRRCGCLPSSRQLSRRPGHAGRCRRWSTRRLRDHRADGDPSTGAWFGSGHSRPVHREPITTLGPVSSGANDDHDWEEASEAHPSLGGLVLEAIAQHRPARLNSPRLLNLFDGAVIVGARVEHRWPKCAVGPLREVDLVKLCAQPRASINPPVSCARSAHA